MWTFLRLLFFFSRLSFFIKGGEDLKCLFPTTHSQDILAEIMEQNLDSLENGRYLTPDEKYRRIRSLPHLMLLIDGDANEKDKSRAVNVFHDRRVDKKRLQAIFKSYPVKLDARRFETFFLFFQETLEEEEEE